MNVGKEQQQKQRISSIINPISMIRSIIVVVISAVTHPFSMLIFLLKHR